MSAALRAHRRFDVLLAVLVPVLLYFVLLAPGSLAGVLSLILSRDTLWLFTVSWMTTGSCGVASSSTTLWQFTAPKFASSTSNATWLAVGAGASVVQFTCSADCEGWSERLVAAAVRRWFPISLQHHCVVLWAVSTLTTKAYIAASCHGLVRRFVRHRWRVLDLRVSLSSGSFTVTVTVTRYFPSRVFLTFSLALHAGATHAF